MSYEISPDVRTLLHDHVETYEQLEVLLLFGRDGYLSCGAANAADQLNLTISAAAEALVVASVGAAFRLNRLAIMHLLTENAMERVRTSALRTFAGAFLLGKKHDG